MSHESTLALILTTEADTEAASALARHLVDGGLAACVTLYEVRSTYTWDGAVTEAAEAQLVIKTTRDGVPAAVNAIGAAHSYELPEIVVLDAHASEAYGTWVAGAVAAATRPVP